MYKANYQRNLNPKTKINWDNLPVFLTIKQASAIMNCSYSTIRNLGQEGLIPFLQLGTRLYRIEKDELRKVIERGLGHDEDGGDENCKGDETL